MTRKRLAIITTHPIQYYAPLFNLLAKRNIIDIKVFYTFSQSKTGEQFDQGFGKIIKWDIPLLDGYNYEFVDNISKVPGTYHFNGIINPSLNAAITQWKPDFILVFGWSFKSHLKCLLHFKKKIPILFRGDSNIIDKKNWIKRVARSIFLRWVYAHVDYALYVGSSNKSYYLHNGLKEQQLLFAPHAIDNERFSCNEQLFDQQASERKIALGIPEQSIVFLFAGKLEIKKNPEMLIKAFLKLSLRSHLIIVGNGLLEKDLKNKYCFENIHFIDFQNQTEMPVIYRMSDVFVLPSSGPGETWGLAVNEAMASARAVIVSDKCGCASDLVVNGKNGYIFKSISESDLLKKMQLMVEKKTLRQMGQYSKGIIKEWSIEKICKQIENVVSEGK